MDADHACAMAGGVKVEIFFFPGALLCGFGLDLLLGDPERWPHPVRAMGRMIIFLEKGLRGGRKTDLLADKARFPKPEDQACDKIDIIIDRENDLTAGRAKRDRMKGAILVAITVASALLASIAALWLCFLIHPALAFAIAAVMCWQCVSVKCLKFEAMKVLRPLERGDLPDARGALSMIVGRDVERLDEEGICKAAMETVAENTADGAVAPLFYMALGGPCLGITYKAVNTLDSMIGYRNEKYIEFGRAAARLDDAAGYIPARLAALCMIAASRLLRQDGRGALHIWRRDRRKHLSPNSAQCEAALAGALGVALGGDSSYNGELVKKPVIGDAGRPAVPADIRTAARLLYAASFIFLPVAFLISLGVSALIIHAGGFAI